MIENAKEVEVIKPLHSMNSAFSCSKEKGRTLRSALSTMKTLANCLFRQDQLSDQSCAA